MVRALALLGVGCALAAQVAPTPAAAAGMFPQAAAGPQITEVRAAAGRGSQDAAFEWVEIHNPGPAPIDLTGWRLADNRAEDAIPATTLASGGYLIVGGSEALADELPGDVQFVVVADGRIGNGLANSGDRVLLIDPSGEAVDGVSWGSDRTIMVLAPPPSGQTLARSGGEWSAATASPGAAHGAERIDPPAEATPEPEPAASPAETTLETEPTDSPAAPTLPLAALRITEIFASTGMGSREAAFEWVEVFNAGAEPVDLTGWTIADNAAVDVLPGGVVAPGARVTIGGSAEAADGGVDVVLEDGRIGNGLANRGDVVTLRDPVGRVVDEVDYRAPPIPLPEVGRSIALSGDVWVLNTVPSPGSDGVTPPPPPAEAEAPAPSQAPAVDDVAAEEDEEDAAAAAVLAAPLAALRITEIFASTGMGSREAAFEWVEVFNAGAEPIDLAGWTIGDNAAVDVLPGGVVAPGARVTIGGSAEAADGTADVVLEDGRIGNGLANRGDVVTLRDPLGRVVDEVDYRAPPIPLPESGRSIALSGDVWVLNTVPSPGSDGVTPPPPPAEAEAPAPSQAPAVDDVAAAEEEEDAAAAAVLAAPLAALRITEIFASTGMGSREAAFEWVEVFNAGAEPVDLTGWTIADNAAVDVLPGGVVAPGAHLTIGGSAEAADGGVDVVLEDGRIGNGLANRGDVVTLRDPLGRVVDEVDYRAPPIPLPEAGRSIALSGDVWVLNTVPSPGSDGVTPPPPPPPEEEAPAPSQAPAVDDVAAEEEEDAAAAALLAAPLAALRITEIFASTGMGSREAAFEWVEVFNAGAEPIDLTGWTIADNAAVDVLPGGVVAPGAHLTIGGSREAADGGVDVVLEDGRIGNGLANRGDVVTLRDPLGRVVDEVDYRAPPIPLPEVGRSIALSGDVWVLNTEPSPGRDGVTPPPPPPPPPPEEEPPDPPQEPREAEVVAEAEVAADEDDEVAPAAQSDGDTSRRTDSGAAAPLPSPPLEITEIFANAGEGSRDAAFEWVEIHNAGTAPIDLAGWTIGDNGAMDELPGVVVAPGAHLTIGGSTEAADGGVDIVVEDGRIGNGLANSGDVVVLRDPRGRIVDEVDYRVPPIPAPEAGRSIALTAEGWVLNTEPSPGSDGVTPLLASLLGSPVASPPTSPEEAADAPQEVAANDVAAEDGGGIPATLLVGVAIGVPLAAIAVRQALRRRRTAAERSDERPVAQEENDD